MLYWRKVEKNRWSDKTIDEVVFELREKRGFVEKRVLHSTVFDISVTWDWN